MPDLIDPIQMRRLDILGLAISRRGKAMILLRAGRSRPALAWLGKAEMFWWSAMLLPRPSLHTYYCDPR